MRRVYAALAILCAFLALSVELAGAQTITVNWSDLSAGSTTHRLFGSNDEMNGQFPVGALDSRYAADLAEMNIRFLRLHSGTSKYWTSERAWDIKKIATEFNAPYIKACGGDNIIVTIDIPPPWCRAIDGSVMDARYAAFCAQLVEIINIKLKRHVRYWEPMNEPNGSQYFPMSWTDVCNLYNLCAKAMKAVDPSIKIGGPTSAGYPKSEVDQFLSICWPNVDFVSWHKYMTGRSSTSPGQIYTEVMQHTGDFVTELDSVRSLIAAHRAAGFDGHKILCDMDEFNIPGDWERYQGWGHRRNIGATFFASVLTHLAYAHIDMAANWSAKEDIFGLIDMDDDIRPPGYFYEWANDFLVGRIAAGSSDDTDCEVLPILRSSGARGGRHAILLINKSPEGKRVTLDSGLPSGENAMVSSIEAAGVHLAAPRHFATSDPVFKMPAYSLTLVVMP